MYMHVYTIFATQMAEDLNLRLSVLRCEVIHTMCVVTHLYVRHDSFKCVTRLVNILSMSSVFRCDLFICVPWIIHMRDITHSYVWHESFICVTWLIHMCSTTHSYVWHDAFTCATWLIHVFDMTYPHVHHASFTCVTWPIHMCDMTRSNVCYDSFICVL